MGTEVTWSSRVAAGHEKRNGKKDEFTHAEKVVSITQEITTRARALHAQQAACTCLFEICSSAGWLPVTAHRHAATLLLKRLYKPFGLSHTIKMSHLVTTVSWWWNRMT